MPLEKSLRCWLFVPGRVSHKSAKAIDSAADAIILDLEDAVAISEKQETPGRIRSHGPSLNQHGEEVSKSIGFTDERIAAARAEGLF